MSGNTFLQIFLMVNVFLIGAIAATAARHAYAHFRPQHHEVEKPHPREQPGAHLPASVRMHMLETAQANFQAILTRSAAELQRDLESTASQLNKQLQKLGNDVVTTEMERYRSELEKLHKQTEAAIGVTPAEITGHRSELKAQLDKEMAAEKEHLLQLIDTKLGDAVASFLTETLQHNVDLGAQSSYLISMLEAHKDDFKKGVVDEAQTTR